MISALADNTARTIITAAATAPARFHGCDPRMSSSFFYSLYATRVRFVRAATRKLSLGAVVVRSISRLSLRAPFGTPFAPPGQAPLCERCPAWLPAGLTPVEKALQRTNMCCVTHNCRIIPNAGRLVQNGWLTKRIFLDMWNGVRWSGPAAAFVTARARTLSTDDHARGKLPQT